MDKTIWKFPLKVADKQNIIMPIGAEILTVQVQNEEPCLWALVDPEAGMESRHIEIFGTGHTIEYFPGVSRKYISTFQLKGGQLHAFEDTGIW